MLRSMRRSFRTDRSAYLDLQAGNKHTFALAAAGILLSGASFAGSPLEVDADIDGADFAGIHEVIAANKTGERVVRGVGA